MKPVDISREKGKCLTRKINEPETNSKNRNIRDLWSSSDEFKAGYQPRDNFIEDETGDQLVECHSTMNGQKYHSSVADYTWRRCC